MVCMLHTIFCLATYLMMDKTRRKALRRCYQELRTHIAVSDFLPSLHVDADGFLTDLESGRIRKYMSRWVNWHSCDEREQGLRQLLCRLGEGGLPCVVRETERLQVSVSGNSLVAWKYWLHYVSLLCCAWLDSLTQWQYLIL